MNRASRAFLVVTVLLLAASAAALADEPKSYGKSLSAAEVVSVVDLLQSPEKFVDKQVRVEGTISDVCAHMGCWIDIAGPDSKVIRFKVNDGEIVFTKDLKGKSVVAEGIFRRIEMTKEDAIARKKHEAEESGKEFDPASVTGPIVEYRIQGVGAVVR